MEILARKQMLCLWQSSTLWYSNSNPVSSGAEAQKIYAQLSLGMQYLPCKDANWTKWWKERSSIIGKDEVWLLISAFCRLSCLRFPNPRKVSLVRCLSELCSRDKLSSLGNHWKVPSAIFVIVLLLRSSTVMLVLSRPWKVVFERETCWVFLRESFCKAVPASSSQRLVVNWRLILL